MEKDWKIVPCENSSEAPFQRSLHTLSVYKDSIYIFGGYDGSQRVNDFKEYHFNTQEWSTVIYTGIPPSPRDRHIAVVVKDTFYIFGGFDGSQRVNDFKEYHFNTKKWSQVAVVNGKPPTPRHSHAAAHYQNSMFLFGGYDGSYRNDFHCFDFGKICKK